MFSFIRCRYILDAPLPRRFYALLDGIIFVVFVLPMGAWSTKVSLFISSASMLSS